MTELHIDFSARNCIRNPSIFKPQRHPGSKKANKEAVSAITPKPKGQIL